MWASLLALVFIPTIWATALDASDLCGTWNEEKCNKASCGGGKWQKSVWAFTDDWRGNYYSFATHEFGDQHCKIYQAKRWDLLTVTIEGTYYMTNTSSYNYQWSEIVFTPQKITVYTPDANVVNGTYTFPDGTCDSPIDYLNRNCPCGAWWRYGEERSVYFDECDPGTCSIFRGIKQYAKVQMYEGHDHQASWLGLTEPTTSLDYYQVETPSVKYELLNMMGCAVTKAMKNCQEDPVRCILEEHREETIDDRDRWWEYSTWWKEFLFPRPPLKKSYSAAGGGHEEENKEEEQEQEQRQDASVDCAKDENKYHAHCIQEDSDDSSHVAVNTSAIVVEESSEKESLVNITDLLIYVGVGIGASLVSIFMGWYFCIQSLAKAPEATSDYNAINDRIVN